MHTIERPALTAFQGFVTDTRGNTMLMVAGMVIPLLAMVGAGVDMSRVYIAKTRLQAACDAGVLAARRIESSDAVTPATRNKAREFFRANMGPDDRQAHSVLFNVDSTITGGTIRATATAKVQPSIMGILGAGQVNLSVNCSATRNLSNADIMFVLDTTGSMAQGIGGDPEPKIDQMRDAVVSFYDEIEAARPSGVTIRYGIVPYAMNVNVGFLLKPEWMKANHVYQTRIPDGTSNETKSFSTTYGWTQLGGIRTLSRVVLAQEACSPPNTASGVLESSTNLPDEVEPASDTNTATVVEQVYRHNGDTYNLVSSGGGLCVYDRYHMIDYIERSRTRTYQTTVSVFKWNYGPHPVDISSLAGATAPATIQRPIGLEGALTPVTYRGCIEERQTEWAPNYDTIPDGALDLKIDMVPTADPATKWAPALPGLMYWRNDKNTQIYDFYRNSQEYDWGINTLCPTPARNLSTIPSKPALISYLAQLQAAGGTHHDIGLLWGARLLSPSGLFAAENAGPQSRHLIFMTDGQIDTAVSQPDAYGLPFLDQRRQAADFYAVSNSVMNNEVEKRFLALCRETRARGMSIWVVAYDTALSPAMVQCAGADKSFTAADADDLNTAFKSIAANIAELRLTE